jgi:hypothetical protein
MRRSQKRRVSTPRGERASLQPPGNDEEKPKDKNKTKV